MRIFKEKAGMISENEIWICIDSCWLYTGDTLFELLWCILKEWRSDKHLVG